LRNYLKKIKLIYNEVNFIDEFSRTGKFKIFDDVTHVSQEYNTVL